MTPSSITAETQLSS